MVARANTEELALIAHEIGAEVIRSPVRYPSDMGDTEVGGVDIGEYLYELKDQEVMVIVAPLFPVQESPTFCGMCGIWWGRDEYGSLPVVVRCQENSRGQTPAGQRGDRLNHE